MAPNLTSGTFNIVSFIDGHPPVGINLTRPAFQSVHLNGRVTRWVIEQDGHNTYRLRIGEYRYTGVLDDRVTASVYPEQNLEWIATYRERQGAYTISPINDDIVGWTVDYNDPNAEVTLRPIASTKSLPPQFLASQLFIFHKYDE